MKMLYLLFAFGSILIFTTICYASDKPENLQRQATGLFDFQNNSISNFSFPITNYGIFALDVPQTKGGGYWPRGSANEYLFASGIWIGAQKRKNGDTGLSKLVELTYNPNNGFSWFVPGTIQDGNKIDSNGRDKNRIYFSTDFNKTTGNSLISTDGPNWPLWITDNTQQFPYGANKHEYINDITKRNSSDYPKGPQFVSDEDIVSIFKDTDLSHYDGGEVIAKKRGYPFQFEIQSRIYSWKSDEMKDVVILSYLIENKSNDTLVNCWVSGVYEIDIAIATNLLNGPSNDRIKYFESNKDLNLTVGWSMTDQGEKGQGFGYIGVSMLETPAVDAQNYIRYDKSIFDPNEQIGLKTSRNPTIYDDKFNDRYNFISSELLDGDSGPHDTRMNMATGPFNMRPGDVARVAFCINFALPAKGGECDGTIEDMVGLKKFMNDEGSQTTLTYNKSLIGGLERARDLYYNRQPNSVIENPTDLNRLSISPNPASDFIELYVGTRRAVSDQSEFKIFNVYGQTVLTVGVIHELPLRVNVSGLAPGMYFVRIGESVQKFIKF